MKKIVCVSLLILCFGHSVRSQFIESINPSNVDDPRFIFSNPAYFDSSTTPFVVAGYQKLYPDLTGGLSNRLIGLVVPTRRYGHFALTAPGFQSPHFNRTAIEFRYSYTLKNLRTALGANAGTMLTMYNSKNYNLVDAYDPLLGNLSLNVLNIGLGATSRPMEKLTIGLTADHINRPRVSFQGGMRRNVHLQAGAMYELWKLKPMMMWELDEGEHYYSFGSEIWFKDLPVVNALMARAALGSEFLSLGAGLSYKNLRLDYLFDYPHGDLSIITGGTHQVVMSYNLAATPCDEPPFAHVTADKDVIQIGSLSDCWKQSQSEELHWCTPHVFSKNNITYEILNPQANPFVNYVFFSSQSANLASSEALDKICNYYKATPQQSKVHILLSGHINGGKNCTCENQTCEKNESLAMQRVEKVRTYLLDRGVPDSVIIINDSVPRFNDCIKIEMELKKERQRVDVQLVNSYDDFFAWDYSFGDHDYRDQKCLFDFSRSQAVCGWQKWFLGVWRIENGQTNRVWQKIGSSKAPDKLPWILSSSLQKTLKNQTLFYQLGIIDKSQNSDLSDIKSIRLVQRRPDRLLLLFNYDRFNELLGFRKQTPEGSQFAEIGTNISKQEFDLLYTEEIKIFLRTNLKPLYDFFKNEGAVIDSIVGYTDSIGDQEYNRTLSQLRAYFVKRYLSEELQIAIDDNVVDGVGENEPIASNAEPSGRWLNRRVEIRVRYQ